MGLIFDSVLRSLGLGVLVRPPAPAAPAAAPAGEAPPAPVTGAPAVPSAKADGFESSSGGTATAAPPKAVEVVDVVADLEARAAKYPHKLNWRYSIVDLLTLLGVESSYAARKELATELGCPEDRMDDSAEMNTWLHKEVLSRIAANGGNIPGDLLD